MNQAPIELRKLLGRRDVLALAFGAMIGWGWVVLSGEMIERAGTLGSALAFAVGAVLVLLVGLTYAELTSALSRAGGELTFTYVGLGRGFAFLCGWALVLAYLAVCAFEAVALPTVVGYLFAGFEVGYLYRVAGWDVHASWVGVGAAGALAIGVVNYFGLRMAAVVQWTAATVLFLLGLSFFIPGFVQGDAANLTPLFTSWEGFLRVVMMTPFLFLGFDIIPQVAEEIRLPFRAVGRVILLSILIALVWYVLVQWTVGFNLGPTERAGQLTTADAMASIYGGAWAGRLLVFGGLLGIITSWNAFFIGATRILFAMSRGGMLPPLFSRLHPRHESPVAAIALVTGLSMIAPFFGRPVLVWIVDAGSFAAVVAYLLVTISFLRIRSRYPDLERPYRVPAPGLVGALALLATLVFLVLYLPGSPSALAWPHEWLTIVLWAVLGVGFWVATRRRIRELGAERQAVLLLGDYAYRLGLAPREQAQVSRTTTRSGG
jgi:basic amino acid/polyamine antiporter, APA family